MKRYLISLGALLALCVSSLAAAIPATKQVLIESRFIHAGGPTFNARFGYGWLDTPSSDLFGIYSPDEYSSVHNSNNVGSFVWAVNGGYDFLVSPNALIGLQAGLEDLGQSKYSSSYEYHSPTYHYLESAKVKITQYAINALVTGRYYVTPRINVFAGAGGAFVRVKERQNLLDEIVDSGGTHSYPSDWTTQTWRLLPEVQIGVGTDINKYLGVHVVFDHIFNGNTGNWQDLIEKRHNAYGSSSVMAGISVKIPILQQTPVVGHLFRSSQKPSKKNLSIMVKPRIVSDH